MLMTTMRSLGTIRILLILPFEQKESEVWFSLGRGILSRLDASVKKLKHPALNGNLS